jgi:uncharacterized protein (TIGR03118 family)
MLQLSGLLNSARPRLAAGACIVGLALGACGGGGGYGGGGGAPPPTPTISVSPKSIVLGQSAQLTWAATAGTSCVASGAWTGAEPPSGGPLSVTPTATGTLTYTLTCTGGAYGGSGSMQQAALTVTAPSGYTSTLLVSDTPGVGALTTDVNLRNPWGVAFGPAFSWVANNHSETSTLYDGNGKPQPAAVPPVPPLVVSFAASPAGVTFDPTGVVYNSTSDFVVTSAAKSAAALFIFTGEGGMIAGWSPTVDPANAITMYTDTAGSNAAVYKGLALANNGTANFLYAADFHNGKVDVFDAKFVKQTPSATSFTFVDPTLPAGYAPFGIQALKTGTGATQIYVAYAQQNAPANHDNNNGAGLGFVDVYDTNGQFVSHLIPTGARLNAPWGLALAPAGFGTLSGMLLVGNFGDGKINGYDPSAGTYIGTVADATGTAFAVPGLWGIAFGNDAANQPHNTLFYAAGTNNEANGAYGRIDLGGAPTLNAPPVVAVTAPAAGSVSGTVTLTATAQDSIAIATVELFAGAVSLGKLTAPPYSAPWDTTKVANGNVALTATATDVDGNVGTSPTITVTVSNGVAAATLSQVQASVFGPICSGCHTGVGATLPGVQNLTTAANSFASLVGVASIEQPALMRVKPGDAANSYVIQKLEGAPTITGARMPFGGPDLPQATIDQIKSWINAGAANN